MLGKVKNSMTVSFSHSIILAKNILESLSILEKYNPRIFYGDNPVSQLRGKSYIEQWEIYTKNYWFHILLSDGSLLIFDNNSYRYLMSPVQTPTRDEFIHSEFGDEWDDFDEEQQNDYLSSSDFAINFQNYVDSITSHSPYTPIRYDMSLDVDEYCKYTHPAFHLHIGFENNSRIPVKIKMTPFSFCLFILSTFYPKVWKSGIKTGVIDADKYNRMKANLDNISGIDQSLWCSDFEEKRIYIG